MMTNITFSNQPTIYSIVDSQTLYNINSRMTTLAQLNKPGGSSKTDAARTKIVIRRLPPALPEEIFWKSVGTWVSDYTASWKQYVAGRLGDE
jgi:hypothetical protein